jgi:hypothetical protein
MQTIPTPTKPANLRTKALLAFLTVWSVFEVASVALLLFMLAFFLIVMFAPADWLPAAFTVIK